MKNTHTVELNDQKTGVHLGTVELSFARRMAIEKNGDSIGTPGTGGVLGWLVDAKHLPEPLRKQYKLNRGDVIGATMIPEKASWA